MFGLGGLVAKLGLDMLWGRVKTNARNDWNALSPKMHLYIIGALVAVALFLAHQWYAHHLIKKAHDEGYAQGKADEFLANEKKAATVTTDMAAAVNPISERKKAEHEASLRDIHTAADALRLRGAGKAECRDPAFSAAAGGHDPAGDQPGGPALPKVPYPEWSALMAMPVSVAVSIGEDHDALLSEVKTWHGWYNDTYAAWEKQAQQAAKPTKR